jgi:hypothetical protein
LDENAVVLFWLSFLGSPRKVSVTGLYGWEDNTAEVSERERWSFLPFFLQKTRPTKPEDLVFTRLIALFYLLQKGAASNVTLVDWGCGITQYGSEKKDERSGYSARWGGLRSFCGYFF